MLAYYEETGEIEVLVTYSLDTTEGGALERERKRSGGPRVITVTSGNGGVGKSSVVINLAVNLAQGGARVLVVDADLGTGDVCFLLGKLPPYTLHHVLSGEKQPQEIVVEGCGFDILPAGMGVQDFAALSPFDRARLSAAVEELGRGYDFCLIDPGAGISANVTSFAVPDQEILLVLTPELTSLTDAYALLKTLSVRYGKLPVKVLVNKCTSQGEGEALYRKLSTITGRFLEVSPQYLGYLLTDDCYGESVRRRGALCRLFPDAPPAFEFARLAQKLSAGGEVALPLPLEPQAKEWRKHELSS